MKIFFFCNDMGYFLRHRRHIADVLSDSGHEVSVIAGGNPHKAELNRDWQVRYLPIERFRLHPLKDLYLTVQAFLKLRSGKADAVQLITLKPAVFCGLAAYLARRLLNGPKRVVITIPGLGRLMSPDSMLDGMSAKLSRYLIEKVMRLLSTDEGFYFTFETLHDQAFWLKKGLIPADRSVVTSGAGVDDTVFRPVETKRSNEGPIRILFASRLLRTKGLDVFLSAAERLASRTDVAFLVAGMAEEGDPDSYSAEELAQKPAIHFLGEVRDMASLLRSVDIVCLPTRYGEGIPRILIEAAASGLPSIASDIEGCRAIVIDNQTGILVAGAPSDTATHDIEQAILRYAEDRSLIAHHGDAALVHFRDGRFADRDVMATFMELLAVKQ